MLCIYSTVYECCIIQDEYAGAETTNTGTIFKTRGTFKLTEKFYKIRVSNIFFYMRKLISC